MQFDKHGPCPLNQIFMCKIHIKLPEMNVMPIRESNLRKLIKTDSYI